jgi:hypothetical protein
MGIGTGKAWLEVGQGPCLNFEFFPVGGNLLCVLKSPATNTHTPTASGDWGRGLVNDCVSNDPQ